MKFSKISLQNWKNFATVEGVPLQDRCFLIGPNASGKSNLLDVFRFLKDLAAEGLYKAVNARGGVSKLRAAAGRRHSSLIIDCSLTSQNNDEWQYYLEIKQNNQRIPYVEREHVKKNDHTVLDRPLKEERSDSELISQTYLEQVSMNRNFREIANHFKSINYLHVVPHIIREQGRIVPQEDDPYGSDFLDHISKVNANTRKAWLKRIEDAVKIAVPQFEDFKLEKDNKGVPHLMVRYKHWRRHGSWQNESDMSDGTLRLLGFLWALLEGKGLLLLEEPELSLHPEVVRNLPQIMAKVERKSQRQIIVSTHSPEMLADEGIAPEEVLLLIPGEEGTQIMTGFESQRIKSMMEAGLSAAESAFPEAAPENPEQLSLLDWTK
ncbi:MAG: AAA family ATPase [bacterium]